MHWLAVTSPRPQELLRIKSALVAGWDAGVFSFGAKDGVAEGEKNEAGVIVTRASAAIRSPVFWTYTCMMNLLGDTVLRLHSWVEGCACHHDPNDDTVQSKPPRQPQSACVCPMKGLRAPHMAAGAMWDVLAKLLSVANSWLWTEAMLLEPATGAAVMQDFSLARQSLEMTLRLKLSFWEHLPHQLCSLAHENPDKVQQGAQRALCLLAAAPQSDLEHPLVRRLTVREGVVALEGLHHVVLFCVNSSAILLSSRRQLCLASLSLLLLTCTHHKTNVPITKASLFLGVCLGPTCLSHRLPAPSEPTSLCLRLCLEQQDDLRKLAGGVPLAELQELEKDVAKLRFISIAERHIEGQHAQIHKHLSSKPHGGPKYVAWSLVRKQIMAVLFEPRHLEGLAHACEKVRNVGLALEHFGFQNHPVVVKAVQDHASWREAIKKDIGILNKVLLRADPPTVFSLVEVPRVMAVDVLQPADPAPFVGPGRLAAQAVFKAAAELGTAVERMFVVEAVEHFRDFCSKQGSHRVYCLRGAGVVKGMPSAVSHMQSWGRVASKSVDKKGSFTFQTESELFQEAIAPEPALAVSSHMCFFTLVCLRPGRKRLMRSTISREAVCVAIHDVVKIDDENRTVCLYLEKEDGTAVRPVMVNLAALSGAELGALGTWQHSELGCSLPPGMCPGLNPADLRESLLELVKAGALPGTENVYTILPSDVADKWSEALTILETASFVERVSESPDVAQWRLTSQGIRNLRMHINLRCYEPVLAPPREIPENASDLSTWQILAALHARGWQASLPKKGDMPPFQHAAPDSKKVWYIKASTRRLPRPYLLALLSAHEGRITQPVPHKGPLASYTALLQGKEWRPRVKTSKLSFAFTDVAAAPLPPVDRRKSKPPRPKRAPRRSSSSSSSSSRSTSTSVNGTSSSSSSSSSSTTADCASQAGTVQEAELAALALPGLCLRVCECDLEKRGWPECTDLIMWHITLVRLCSLALVSPKLH